MLGRAGEASGDLARCLMHASRHLAARLSRTASGLEGAGLTVELAGSVEPHVVFGPPGPRDGERPAVLLKGFASGTWFGVRAGIKDEVRAAEGSVSALALVPHRYMRRDVLFLHQPGEDLRRSVGFVGAKPPWLQTEAGLRSVEHGLGRTNLGWPADACRLDIDDDRRLEVDQIVVGVGKEGVPLVSARPLRRGVRRRDELRNNLAGRAPGGVIERVEIFPHGAPRRRPLLPIDLIGACKRALLVGVSRDQAGVDGETFTADQALGDRALHHQLEEAA